MASPSERGVFSRLRGSGSVARAIVLWTFGLSVLNLVANLNHWSAETVQQWIAVEVLIAALAVRSLSFGIYISDDTLRIVSWFKTYDFSVDSITEVLDLAYDDYWTMGAQPQWVERRLRKVGVRRAATERVTSFPATFGGTRTIARLVTQLGEQWNLPVRRVEYSLDSL